MYLFNYGFGDGTPSISETASQMLHHGDDEVESCLKGRETSYEVDQRSCFTDGTSSVFHHEYMNKKNGTLNKKSSFDLNNPYKNKKNIEKIITFVGDKAGLSNDQNIDKKLYVYKTLNTLDEENLNKFTWLRDNTRFLTEILAIY